MFIFIYIFSCLITAYFCSSVAEEKGYGGQGWALAGFFFGIFALIAVAGLPDKKLRKYLRQIGVKQNAIKVEKKISFDKKTISFVMPSGANKLQIFNKLKSEIKKNEEYEEIFNKYKIKSYGLNESLLGGKEFVIEGDKEESLFIMSSKKINNIQIEWTGNL